MLQRLNTEQDADLKSINVQDFFNSQPFSLFQWLIFFICFLIVLLDGFDTAAIGFIAPSLIKEWGVSKLMLAPVLSAALLGLSVGSFSAGPISAKLGRKFALGISVLLFGIACTASSFSPSLNQLVILRFITGLGLGAALPNAVAMMSEFCPDQRRSTMTNAMFCGFPLGAALGGFLAAWIIPLWGWRSVLLIGGLLPILLAIPIFMFLPESVRYMVAMKKPIQRIRAVLGKISATALTVQRFTMTETSGINDNKKGLQLTLSRPFVIGTVMMWLAYFMGLLIFYSMINWMPILFKDIGISPTSASLISALFLLGGVFAILLGWLMDRFNANLIVAAGYAMTAIVVFVIGQATGNVGLLSLAVFFGGVVMNASQASMGSLAAAFYPTQARVTGLAWMFGVGRFGGVAGSFFVAELSKQKLEFSQIFAMLAVAGIIASIALLIKNWQHPRNSI